MHLGVVRRLALSVAGLESGEVGRTMDGEVGESELKTLWLTHQAGGYNVSENQHPGLEWLQELIEKATQTCDSRNVEE